MFAASEVDHKCKLEYVVATMGGHESLRMMGGIEQRGWLHVSINGTLSDLSVVMVVALCG